MEKKRLKIAVGLSGGVDSSVTSALLLKEGHQVTGITMEIFDPTLPVEEGRKHACYGPGEKEDLEAASAVCQKLGIPFHVIDLKEEYRRHVIDYFKKEYLAGRTPNPCIVCNQQLKFGFLLEKAKESGADFDFFATGHYARIVHSGGRFLLKKALDTSKDQSYFLYALTPQQLSQTLFPLGIYTKERVREMAHHLKLHTAERPESQDFIGGGDYTAFFHDAEMREGDIIDENGRVLGRHRGVIRYTIGQRKGLGISAPKPLYVSKIEADKNRIVVSHQDALFSKGLIAHEFKFIAVEELDQPKRVQAKIRLQHPGAEATAYPSENGKVQVVFKEPQLSVTPGQSVVLYLGDTVLGGGMIESAL